MVTLLLALRNTLNAGLRTWLNVAVLSFAFVLIVFLQGIYQGMMEQVQDGMIDAELGGGQWWQEKYDPYDPFSIEESHASLPPQLSEYVAKSLATPILITQAAVFPGGKVHSALLKGIDPSQRILTIPSNRLTDRSDSAVIPALIGSQMAKSTGLQKGDYVTVRWKNIHGTFDAADIRIVYVMHTAVQTIDKGQIWISLEHLRKMIGTPGEASIVVAAKGFSLNPEAGDNWVFRNHAYLLRDLHSIAAMKQQNSYVLLGILLGMGLLAIFNTQVLSIFRRRKEIGTLMALGMTRLHVITLITLEGSFAGALALVAGALYGIPLITYFAAAGFAMPEAAQSTGFSIGSVLYPKYSLWLYAVTSVILFLSVTVTSFLPTKQIARMKPTDALKGKGV